MPPRRTTPTGFARARLLRKSPTPAEGKLWAYLRHNLPEGVRFRRQHAIGNYVVDFCAIKNKLIIELDGSQHLDQVGYDAERTAYLESQGYHVIRFWNHEVMDNIDGVFRAILAELVENK
jgi:very-short-patch-repair endonuclease